MVTYPLAHAHFMKLIPVLIAISLSAGSVTCYAGGYISPWLSTWYLGLAGSGTAGIQDPGTILINPANATWLAKPGVQLNSGLNWSDAAFLEAGSFVPAASRTAAFSTLSASLVWRKKAASKYTWGLTISSPYSMALQWPQDWEGSLLAQELFINSLFVTPSVSIALGNRLSLGIGVGAGVINVSTARALNISGGGNVLPAASLNGRRYAFRLQAGLSWQISTSARLGISYHSATSSDDITGDATFTPPASLASFFPNTDFTLTLPGPAELRAGLAFHVDQRWELLVDAHFSAWSAFDTFRTTYTENTALLTNDKQAWLWNNTIAVSLGSIWEVGRTTSIFIGTSFDPSPVPNDRVSPLLPDGSKIGFSGGFALQATDHLDIHIATGYRISGERLGFLEARNFGGTYQLQDISAQIGLNWRW